MKNSWEDRSRDPTLRTWIQTAVPVSNGTVATKVAKDPLGVG